MNWLAAVVALSLAVVCAATAWMDAMRHPRALAVIAELGLGERIAPMLALVKTLAATGLVVGLVSPPVALWAAAGTACYFTCAVHAHSRAGHGTRAALPAASLLAVSLLLVLVELAR